MESRPSYDSSTGHFHVRYSHLGNNFRDNVNDVGFIRDDNRRELDSAATVAFETYNHRIGVESLSALSIASTSILPAALTHQRNLAETMEATEEVLDDKSLLDQEREILIDLVKTISEFHKAHRKLHGLVEERFGMMDDAPGRARFNRDRVLPAMAELRAHADLLETLVDDALWPLPKYRELLYVR